MAGLLPVVRHLLVCEDLVYNPTKRQSVSLKNLLGNIRPMSHPPYPLRYPQLCVYVQLSECRGDGEARLRVEEADTNTLIYQTPKIKISLGNDPLKKHGLPFRIRDLLFPSAGLYSVEFWYNDVWLGEETLLLE
jgi:hypothetical protein